MNEYIIEQKRGTSKWRALVAAFNQGIDSHLEAFTRSRFAGDDRYGNDIFRFDRSELHILVRRLREAGDPVSVALATDVELTQKMDPFTRAFIVAALWSGLDDQQQPLDKQYGPQDLAPETLASITEECQRFQTENAALLADLDPDRCGHDLCLTRNHEGAGFWDRDLGEVGDKLTEAAHHFGECSLYVGDDGKLYV